MKVVALVLFIFGLTAASAESSYSVKALDAAVDDVVAAFEHGMDTVGPFEDPLMLEAMEASEDSKQALLAKLKEALDETMKKIRDHINDKETKAKDLLNKAHELAEQLKQLKAKLGDKAKEVINNYKEKISNLFEKIIDRIRGGNREKREVSAELSDEVILDSLLLRPLLERVKAKIEEHFSVEALTRYVNQLFGKYSPVAQGLVEALHEYGVKGLLRVIDRLLEKNSSTRQTRAIGAIIQTVRDFFKNLGLNLQDRFADFAEWLSGVWGKGVDHAKDKVGKLREIAKEVINHAKEMHKETIREAIEVLRPFKQELGSMWEDLLTAARDALKKKE